MRIRIATLNVWALPAFLGEDVAARMRAIGHQLPDLDLDAIAFQEVWTPDARDSLVAAGRRAGLDQAWHNDAAYGASGLLVLSRLPIAGVRFEAYSLRGHPERFDQGDFYAGKGFARVELETPKGPVTLVNTHLHARYGSSVRHKFRPHRAGQVVQLALRAREVSHPLVTLGDFNFREGNVGYEVLTGLTGLRDAAAELDHRQPTLFKKNRYRARKSKSDRRVDYVFLRDGAERGLVTRRIERIFDRPVDLDGRSIWVSNHAGVLAEIEISERPGAPPAAPRRDAIEMAAGLLRAGSRAAELRQRDGRALAGTGLGFSILAAASLRRQPVSRRRLLRHLAHAAAFAALTPAVGFSLLSEVYVPEELAAFEKLAATLHELEPAAGVEAIA